jgi:ATP-dependent Lon protease
MPTRLLPLFPLQVVVFPRTPLPLHIFEERYKEMVGIAIRDNSEFGVVLAKEDGIVNVGCTVRVQKVLEIYPDGRLDVVTQGERRFEILTLNEEQVYLQAEVRYFDDTDFAVPPDDLRVQVLDHYNNLIHLDSSRGHTEPDLRDPQLSFQLAPAVPDVDFLHMLLRNRSEADRLKELNQYLEEYIPRRRLIERIRQVAPTNGYGGRHMET